MGNQKKIITWSVNIVLFMVVVYMGITQAGLGVEMTRLENEISVAFEKKYVMSESILIGNSTAVLADKSKDLGFAKPKQIVYIDSLDSFASLLY